MMICLAAALVLSGCGKSTAEEPAGESIPQAGQETKQETEQGVVYDDSLLEEYISASGVYNDEYMGEIDYEYHLPHLKAEAGGNYELFNSKIDELVGDEIQKDLRIYSGEDTEEISYLWRVDYESHWNGSLLSVVISEDTYFDDLVIYHVLNYDVAEGKMITFGREIIERSGVSEADARKALAAKSVAASDACFNYINYEYSNWYLDDGADMRVETAEEKLNADLSDLNLFLGENGTLHSMSIIYIPAGAGFFYQDVEIDTEFPEIEKTVSAGGFTATLKNNEITVTAADGKDYPLQGCYSIFTDLFMGTIDAEPYLFAFTREGNVEYTDLTRCLQAGVFVGGNFVPGLTAVKELRQTGDSVTAVIEGAENDIGQYVRAANSYVTEYLLYDECGWQRTTSVNGADVFNTLYFMGGNAFNVERSSTAEDAVEYYTGMLHRLGCLPSGVVYYYEMQKDGPVLTGTIAIDKNTIFDDKMKVTLLAGDMLFLDAGTPGKTFDMLKVYG